MDSPRIVQTMILMILTTTTTRFTFFHPSAEAYHPQCRKLRYWLVIGCPVLQVPRLRNSTAQVSPGKKWASLIKGRSIYNLRKYNKFAVVSKIYVRHLSDALSEIHDLWPFTLHTFQSFAFSLQLKTSIWPFSLQRRDQIPEIVFRQYSSSAQPLAAVSWPSRSQRSWSSELRFQWRCFSGVACDESWVLALAATFEIEFRLYLDSIHFNITSLFKYCDRE